MLSVILQSSNAVTCCPESAPFFGFMGVSAALVFASMLNINVIYKSSHFCNVTLQQINIDD